MDPWGLTAALAAAAALVGALWGAAAWLVSTGSAKGEAEAAGYKEQRDEARAALAAELEARDARARGALADWEADRAIRDAASDPDPVRKRTRLLELLAAAEAGAAPPGKPPAPDDSGGEGGA